MGDAGRQGDFARHKTSKRRKPQLKIWGKAWRKQRPIGCRPASGWGNGRTGTGPLPLGLARAQNETYVLAQTHDGFVIVDQHAAHERLVYERTKAQIAEAGIKRQILLVPEVAELKKRRHCYCRADELAERLSLKISALRKRGKR